MNDAVWILLEDGGYLCDGKAAVYLNLLVPCKSEQERTLLNADVFKFYQ